MMARDVEWSALVGTWQSFPADILPDAALVRARVDAQSRRMRIWQILEMAVTIVAIAASVIELRREPDWTGALIAADIWVTLTAAWAFVWLGRSARRGPVTLGTEDYVRIARMRARQRRALVWLTIAVLAGQWLINAVVHQNVHAGALLLTTFCIGWAGWQWHGASRELRWLERFQADASEREPAGV
jgi:hypothetical protein